MKLLLDTHIWLWSHLSPNRLSTPVIRELNRSTNERWLSPVSIWELVLLVEKGRVVLAEDLESWLAHAAERSPIFEAPLNQAIALETLRVKLPYRDPADRLLVATARLLNLTLVTGDRRLIQARQAPVFPNS